MDDRASIEELVVVLATMHTQVMAVTLFAYLYLNGLLGTSVTTRNSSRRRRYSLLKRIPAQVSHLNDIINAFDVDCVNNLRLNRNAFGRLCIILEQLGGLKQTRGISISEQVAMFLSVLAHHKKNMIVKHDFKRSGRTVSIHFRNVLSAILKIYNVLVATPEPVPEDSINDRWKWFKGCLGALDGTYIQVKVSESEHARYRTRKGQICVNMLGVCDRNMNFVYVLTGWEGSAADGNVLRDAVYRPNGLKVPRGQYYLCDAGYANGEGFLAPYRGVRYHLKEWGAGMARPQNPRELFNLRHSKARNVIERAFACLKNRWAVLRSKTFYSIDIQNRIIIACCLLHNFIRREMPNDPFEVDVPENEDDNDNNMNDNITNVEASQLWTDWRDNLANEMYNNCRQSG